jgi:hypothetical protein
MQHPSWSAGGSLEYDEHSVTDDEVSNMARIRALKCLSSVLPASDT